VNILRNNFFVFIAVRLKSSRLPKKALEKIHDKEMLLILIDRLSKVFHREQIIICTSNDPQDNELIEFANSKNIPSYAGDSDDVISRFLGAADKFGATTIARVTGDNPFTDPIEMEKMLIAHHENSAEYTFNTQLPVGTRSEIIEVCALQRIHNQLVNPKLSEYMTYMLNRPDMLITNKYFVKDQYLIRPELSLTVDTPKDIELIRKICSSLNKSDPTLHEIIKWLDLNSSYKILVDINQPAPKKILSQCSYKKDLRSFS